VESIQIHSNPVFIFAAAAVSGTEITIDNYITMWYNTNIYLDSNFDRRKGAGEHRKIAVSDVPQFSNPTFRLSRRSRIETLINGVAGRSVQSDWYCL
jgi:hypothetical protein